MGCERQGRQLRFDGSSDGFSLFLLFVFCFLLSNIITITFMTRGDVGIGITKVGVDFEHMLFSLVFLRFATFSFFFFLVCCFVFLFILSGRWLRRIALRITDRESTHYM